MPPVWSSPPSRSFGAGMRLVAVLAKDRVGLAPRVEEGGGGAELKIDRRGGANVGAAAREVHHMNAPKQRRNVLDLRSRARQGHEPRDRLDVPMPDCAAMRRAISAPRRRFLLREESRTRR